MHRRALPISISRSPRFLPSFHPSNPSKPRFHGLGGYVRCRVKRRAAPIPPVRCMQVTLTCTRYVWPPQAYLFLRSAVGAGTCRSHAFKRPAVRISSSGCEACSSPTLGGGMVVVRLVVSDEDARDGHGQRSVETAAPQTYVSG